MLYLPTKAAQNPAEPFSEQQRPGNSVGSPAQSSPVSEDTRLRRTERPGVTLAATPTWVSFACSVGGGRSCRISFPPDWPYPATQTPWRWG